MLSSSRQYGAQCYEARKIAAESLIQRLARRLELDHGRPLICARHRPWCYSKHFRSEPRTIPTHVDLKTLILMEGNALYNPYVEWEHPLVESVKIYARKGHFPIHWPTLKICACGKAGKVRYQGTDRFLCSDCLVKEGQKEVDGHKDFCDWQLSISTTTKAKNNRPSPLTDTGYEYTLFDGTLLGYFVYYKKIGDSKAFPCLMNVPDLYQKLEAKLKVTRAAHKNKTKSKAGDWPEWRTNYVVPEWWTQRNKSAILCSYVGDIIALLCPSLLAVGGFWNYAQKVVPGTQEIEKYKPLPKKEGIYSYAELRSLFDPILKRWTLPIPFDCDQPIQPQADPRLPVLELYRGNLNLYKIHYLPISDFPVLMNNLKSDFNPSPRWLFWPATTKAERNAQRSEDAWFLRYGEIKPDDLDDEEEDWFEHEFMKNNWFDIPKKEDTGYGRGKVDVRTYNGRTKNIWHYTHDLFSAEKFRRCRGQFIDDFVPPKNCLWEAHKSTCWGCEYAVETNLKERVLGLDHIISFMRWPVVCRLTFANVPVPNMPISATELSRQFRSMRSLGYPSWSHPTIKKWMNKPQNQIGRDRIGRIAVLGSQWFIKLTKRYWIDYGSYLDFMHTPVDSLLRKYPVEGAHVLISLSKVPDKWIPPGQTELADFKTTGQNLIDLLGQKSFNLLNANLSASGRVALVAHGRTSGILFKIDPIGVKQSELYFARPYFYRQYPGLNQQYKDYQNEFWFELIITILGGRFH